MRAFSTRAAEFRGFSSGLKGLVEKMSVKEQIEARLVAAFHPDELVVTNESHRHAGHAGDDGSGESHFHIRIRAAALAGLGRVDRTRAVNRALGDLTRRIHALGLDIG